MHVLSTNGKLKRGKALWMETPRVVIPYPKGRGKQG